MLPCNSFPLEGDGAFECSPEIVAWVQAYEKRPAYLAGLGMELALAFLEAGEAEQAHSLMFPDNYSQLDLGTRFRVRAASGQLRYYQWRHAWQNPIPYAWRPNAEHLDLNARNAQPPGIIP